MKNTDPADVFAVISNPVRLRCLHLVATENDVCVREVEAALQIAQPTASKALNALKAVGLVTAARVANRNYYSLDQSMPAWCRTMVESTVERLSEQEPYRSDKRRLSSLAPRPDA